MVVEFSTGVSKEIRTSDCNSGSMSHVRLASEPLDSLWGISLRPLVLSLAFPKPDFLFCFPPKLIQAPNASRNSKSVRTRIPWNRRTFARFSAADPRRACKELQLVLPKSSQGLERQWDHAANSPDLLWTNQASDVGKIFGFVPTPRECARPGSPGSSFDFLPHLGANPL